MALTLARVKGFVRRASDVAIALRGPGARECRVTGPRGRPSTPPVTAAATALQSGGPAGGPGGPVGRKEKHRARPGRESGPPAGPVRTPGPRRGWRGHPMRGDRGLPLSSDAPASRVACGQRGVRRRSPERNRSLAYLVIPRKEPISTSSELAGLQPCGRATSCNRRCFCFKSGDATAKLGRTSAIGVRPAAEWRCSLASLA